MIKRLISLLFLAWVLGFAWFALLLPLPAGDQTTDAIVVLTGGPGRIDRGLELLEAGRAATTRASGSSRPTGTCAAPNMNSAARWTRR